MIHSTELQANELSTLTAQFPFGIFGWQSKFGCRGEYQLGSIISMKLTNVSNNILKNFKRS